MYTHDTVTATLHMTDPSFCQGGRPMTYETTTVITRAKSGLESPRGLEARTDRLSVAL
jgi:hypothetical protein